MAVFCFGVLALAGPAQAHRIDVYAYFNGAQLQGEGAYSDGSPADGADITVLGADGKVLGRTKSTPEGSFSLTPAQGRPPLKVVINDGGGHRAEFVLEGAPPKAAAAPADPVAPQPAKATAPASFSQEELALLLRRELGPIKAELVRLANRQRVSPGEVVGGLGWIVGLAGLILWLRGRKSAPPGR
ncbi:MAG: hypothetical protein AB1814_17350 [Thermodesulfobacteriota bacterium]